MSLPRVLVVRSGANPFLSITPSERVEVVEKVSHSIQPVEPAEYQLRAVPDFLVFTSQVGVERAFGDERFATFFRKAAESAHVVAVGEVTGGALAAKGIAADLVAGGSAESILERLPVRLDGKRVLLPCGEDGAQELRERLRSRGAQAMRVVLYRKIPNKHDPKFEREIIEKPFAAFCTTSPSAASWLFEGLGDGAIRRLRAIPAVVLGRFTRRFLEGHGITRITVTEEARFSEAMAALEALAAGPAGT
jgi:uroporphyrinogen-III synthase